LNQAKDWFEQEITKFLGVMNNICVSNPDGSRSISFGELFLAYESISDSLVGMMTRCKKRGHINYEGEMLFQGRDDHVIIYLT